MKRDKKSRAHRAHGFGSLEKRGKKYFARWMVDGKRFTRSTGESNVEKAREKLEEFTKPYRIGNEIETLEAHEVRIKGREAELKKMAESRAALAVDQLYGVYKDLPECKSLEGQSAMVYESVLSDFAEWLRKHKPEITEARKVSRLVAREYADVLEQTKAASTRNIYVSMLRRVWRTIAHKENVELEEGGKNAVLQVLEEQRTLARFEFNPWDDVRALSKAGRVHSRRELTIEELQRVCGSVTGEMRVLFAIGIYTGMRCGDCAQLDWSAVDLVRGLISVTPRKTLHRSGMSVVIPIHQVLQNVLMETPKEERIGKVLPECCAAYCKNRSAFAGRLRRVFEKCGIQTLYRVKGKKGRCDVGFHSLRHTFVSMAANAGAPLELVRKIVGHSSPAMTRHYFHAEEKALRDTVAQLPDVTGGEIIEAATVAEGAKTSEAVARVCDEVRRFAASDRAEVVRAALDGLSADEIEDLRKAFENFKGGTK